MPNPHVFASDPVIAGGAGAVVGGLSGKSKTTNQVSSIQVKITIRDINDPSLIIETFNASTMTTDGKAVSADSLNGYLYQQGITDANQILDMVQVIIDEVDRHSDKSEFSVQPTFSIATELKKLSDLKNEGILTQEEFDLQKAKLLNSK